MGKQRIKCDDVPRVQQSAAQECDINVIMEKARRGADLSQLQRHAVYADLIGFPDFRESLLIVRRAEAAFESLDARVRQRFSNSPVMFMEFLNDPANREEAVKLGLLNPPKEVPKAPEGAAGAPPKGGEGGPVGPVKPA